MRSALGIAVQLPRMTKGDGSAVLFQVKRGHSVCREVASATPNHS